jgi:hypothetical protein
MRTLISEPRFRVAQVIERKFARAFRASGIDNCGSSLEYGMLQFMPTMSIVDPDNKERYSTANCMPMFGAVAAVIALGAIIFLFLAPLTDSPVAMTFSPTAYVNLAIWTTLFAGSLYL